MADRRGDALLRAFARDLAKMRRDLRNLEAANQISSASIEGGTLDVYDDDDVLRERIGKQANGSYGRLVLEGPVPPIPSEPDVVVIADGVVAITWDGRSEEKWPFVDFEAVRVHLVEDPVAEVCDRDNQVGVIRSHRGETIVAVTESDDDNPVYARLVAVSAAGHTSDPSPAVLVDELDEDDLDEEPEELEWEDGDGRPITQAEVDAGEVVLSLSHDPEVESLTAVLAGVPQRADKFTVDYDAQTLTLPLSGWERVGDVLWVHYAYWAAPPPPLTYLTLSDTVSVDNSGLLNGSQASLVGTPPIWKDGSDATYAEIVTQMNGAGQPQFGSNASSSVASADLSSVPNTSPLIARLRVAALEADLPYPTVELSRPGAGVSGSITGTCPTVPTWVEIPLTGESMWIVFAEPETFLLRIQSAFKSEGAGEKFWRIYEVQLYVVGE